MFDQEAETQGAEPISAADAFLPDSTTVNAGQTPGAKTVKPGSVKSRQATERVAWSSNVDRPDRFGFFKMKDTPLRTMDDRQYEDILTDEEKWAELSTRMDADFDHALEMFPYAERAEDTASSSVNWIERISERAGNFLKNEVRRRSLSEINLTQRYYAIMRMDIEERFPGGRARGEPGDGDIRDLLMTFRQLFRENLAHYIYKKRLYQIAAIATFVGLATLLLFVGLFIPKPLADWAKKLLEMSQDSGTAVNIVNILAQGATAAILLTILWYGYKIILWNFKDRSQIIFDSYNNSQTESCKTLDKQAALRTKNLFNLIATMAARVDKDESVLDQDIRAEEWPKRAYRWTVVVYWLGRRLENLERYAQLQMWLVRRTHYFYRLIATSSNSVANWINTFILIVASGFFWTFAHYPSHLLLLYYTFIQAPWHWLCEQVHAASHLLGWDWTLARSLPLEFIPTRWVSQFIEAVQTHDPNGFIGLAGNWLAMSAVNILYWLPAVFALVLSSTLIRTVSRLSGANWNTSLDLITDNMDIRNWDRFHSVRLPHLLASQVKADKNNILRRESWVAGKNR